MKQLGTTLLLIFLTVAVVAQSKRAFSFSVLDTAPDLKIKAKTVRLSEEGDWLGYGMEVKNISPKTVIAFTWIYEAELTTSGEKKFVKVGGDTIKARILQEEEKQFGIPPEPDEPLTYRLLLTRIEYEDGTIWERPSN